MEKKKQYIAFISYNHQDVKWAKWLRRRLEWYRLPAKIHNEYSDSRYMRPVFRDRDTLTSGILNDSLRAHLEASQYLVVICSPHAAQSQWVSDEVKAFIEMGRVDRIIPFIVDGSPQQYEHSDIQQPLMGECFPLALRQWNTDHSDKSILGIAVTDDGMTDRNRAFIRIVARILGLDFDALWQRHKRFVRRLTAVIAAFAMFLLMLAYWFMVPVKMSVTVCDEPSALPGMEHGILKCNGSEYPFSNPDTTINVGSLPGYFRLRSVSVSFHAQRFYLEEEQTVKIGVGVRQHVTLQLRRDSTFAVYAGTVYDGDSEDFVSHPVAGATVILNNNTTVTDAQGNFRFEIPLADQSETKTITIFRDGYQKYVREDECPGVDGKYLLKK